MKEHRLPSSSRATKQMAEGMKSGRWEIQQQGQEQQQQETQNTTGIYLRNYDCFIIVIVFVILCIQYHDVPTRCIYTC